MRLKELKELAAVLLASGALALTVSACNGERDTAQDPTPPSSPGIEQPVEASSAETPSNEFDVNTVNVAPIERADIDYTEYLNANNDAIARSTDLLSDLIAQGGQHGDLAYNIILHRIVLTRAADEFMLEEGFLFEGFLTNQGVSKAVFTAVQGEEAMATMKDLFITPEERAAFDQIVIQVIRDAEEHGTSNIYRLLNQILEIDEPNSFISLTAAMLTGYLMARNLEVHSAMIEKIHNHMEYLSTKGSSR